MAPSDFPGVCVVEVCYAGDWESGDSRLWIKQADDLIRIDDRFLELLLRGDGHPDVRWGDGILTIRGCNRTVSYGCTKKTADGSAWIAARSPEVGGDAAA